MYGIGIVEAGFAGLRVRIDGQQWHLLLRRADFSPYPGFAALHNAPVGGPQVARYLPNWGKFAWVTIPDSLITRAESCAQDPPFQVNIRANFSSRLAHEDVVHAFLDFMSHSKT
jgi:hypothetical protein